MKASTAAILLRATRSRFDTFGYVQIGMQETIAIEFAFTITKNSSLKELQAATIGAAIKSKATNQIHAIALTQPMYDAIREGYKALETIPADQDFKISPTGEITKTYEAPEPTTGTIPQWLKDIGIDPKAVHPDDKEEGDLPDTNP